MSIKAGIGAMYVNRDDPAAQLMMQEVARALAEIVGFVPEVTQMQMSLLDSGISQVIIELNMNGATWFRAFQIEQENETSDFVNIHELSPPFLILEPAFVGVEAVATQAKTQSPVIVGHDKNIH